MPPPSPRAPPPPALGREPRLGQWSQGRGRLAPAQGRRTQPEAPAGSPPRERSPGQRRERNPGSARCPPAPSELSPPRSRREGGEARPGRDHQGDTEAVAGVCTAPPGGQACRPRRRRCSGSELGVPAVTPRPPSPCDRFPGTSDPPAKKKRPPRKEVRTLRVPQHPPPGAAKQKKEEGREGGKKKIKITPPAAPPGGMPLRGGLLPTPRHKAHVRGRRGRLLASPAGPRAGFTKAKGEAGEGGRGGGAEGEFGRSLHLSYKVKKSSVLEVKSPVDLVPGRRVVTGLRQRL